jgi:phage terminase small subunit
MTKHKNTLTKTAIRENRFPYEYIIDLNATQAAIRCGCSPRSARTLGARLFAKDAIKTKIQELQNAANNKALLTRDEVERALDDLIRFNLRDFVQDDGTPKEIHELTKEQAACVKELGVIETQIGTSRTMKFFDKVQAIKIKMQRLGMLKDGQESTTESYVEKIKRLRGIISAKDVRTQD